MSNVILVCVLIFFIATMFRITLCCADYITSIVTVSVRDSIQVLGKRLRNLLAARNADRQNQP